MAYPISAGNPYRNLVGTPEGLQKAQDYERNFGMVYSGAPGVAIQPGGMNDKFAPTGVRPTDVQPAATAAPAVDTGASGRLADLIAGGGGSAPGASAPAANPFADATNQYLSSAPPAAPGQATLAPNRYAGGLSAAEQRIQDLISNPDALQNSSSYKFRVQQGQQALERSLGAKGLLQSGNRLTELTNYGQAAGSQEYEAENKRRMDLLNSYAGNYNTDQSNNINLYGIQQGSMDKNYGTAADLYKSRGTTLAGLYGGADTTNTQRYGIDTTANTARANTLADLYRTDVGARTAANAEQTKRMDWAYKSQIDQANALAKAQQALGRMAPNYGPTTENWWQQ